jgi:hypothetical protein
MMTRKAIDDVLAGLLTGLRGRYGGRLVSVALYGSWARGDARPDSDVDLLIVARDVPAGRFARDREISSLLRQAEERLAESAGGADAPIVSAIVKSMEEAAYHSPLYLDMVEDARLLEDQGGFLRGVLEDVRANLGRLGARRIRFGEGWYWDLKPDYKFGDVIEV